MNSLFQKNVKRLNHIQLCIPKNKEAEARAFHCGILGLEEIEKPEDLKKNGGFWLNIADIELPIGTEDLVNQSKRHPAFEVRRLDRIKAVLVQQGIKIKTDRSLPKFHRFSFYDPFNNRIELLEEKTSEELDFLGKSVEVKIDRPIGSQHPDFKFVYPLNYGFIPNTKAGDGQAADAYALGEESALPTFAGIVKAVITRYNDQENKLVLAKAEYEVTEEEIRAQTHFQEQYFDIAIRMIEA